MGEKLDASGALLVLTLALGVPAGAAAEDGDQGAADEMGQASTRPPPTGEMKAWDALAVRPVSFASSVFSTGVFVLTIPFAALDPALDIDKSRENLVQYPFRDTFERPLGDFSGDMAGPPGDSAWSLPQSLSSATRETAPDLDMTGGTTAGGDAAVTQPYEESPAGGEAKTGAAEKGSP